MDQARRGIAQLAQAQLGQIVAQKLRAARDMGQGVLGAILRLRVPFLAQIADVVA